jgi:hypothetical protein
MSAVKGVGRYIISCHATKDEDENLYYVKMGIRSKKGMVIHYTVWGDTEESAIHKAEVLAEILSSDRFNILKHSKIIQS